MSGALQQQMHHHRAYESCLNCFDQAGMLRHVPATVQANSRMHHILSRRHPSILPAMLAWFVPACRNSLPITGKHSYQPTVRAINDAQVLFCSSPPVQSTQANQFLYFVTHEGPFPEVFMSPGRGVDPWNTWLLCNPFLSG